MLECQHAQKEVFKVYQVRKVIKYYAYNKIAKNREKEPGGFPHCIGGKRSPRSTKKITEVLEATTPARKLFR